jgi:hypothetical protein
MKFDKNMKPNAKLKKNNRYYDLYFIPDDETLDEGEFYFKNPFIYDQNPTMWKEKSNDIIVFTYENYSRRPKTENYIIFLNEKKFKCKSIKI